MEIEIKLSAADADVFRAILALDVLGPYRVTAAATEEQRNTYFDTADGRLRAQRAGLRVREVAGRRIATLKTAGTIRDGLHERGEWEALIGSEDTPEQWPAGELRDRALAATGGAALAPVVVVQTLRRSMYAWREERQVAELSLDEGVVRAGGREEAFREVEVEVLPAGERADAEALAGLLRERFGLVPENRSKLARGLALRERAPNDQALPTLALALYDGTIPAHGLPAGARRALLFAASCYKAAQGAGANNPERAGRELALAAPVAGLAANEQALAAGVLTLLRGRVRPRREPALLRLRGAEQTRALRLGAVLRLAAALDGSGGRMRVATENGTTRLYLGGAEAQVAEERADLWRRAIGPLSVLPLEGDAEPLAPVVPKVPPPALPIPDNLRGDEPTSEGARRVLRRFFERLLAREEDVRAGEDPEDVHQMRVATRRLRASLQVAEPVYDAELVRRYRRGLRSVARALGAVRDRDVFLQSLRAYQDGLPEAERAMLNRLIGAVEAERAEARVLLVADLEERRYERFKREFATFLTTPLAGLAPLPETGAPPRVRDVAGSGIWRRYEELRAFEAVLEGAPDETLHAARIAGKRLRYALEFFQDALGPGADDALAPLAALQETLGALQDAVVARQHIADLHLECDPGAISYLAALDATHTRNMADLPAVWGVITGAKYRRRLLDLMAWV